MGPIKLDDIVITPLKKIKTLGGDVMHIMKRSDIGYADFGEAYFSWISIGAIKAWKRHAQMTMNLVVPVGQVRFVFRCFNDTTGADEFRVEEIGAARYARITVPPSIWFGFQGLQSPKSLVLNLSNIEHNPNEIERLSLSDINYDWN